ncbi:tRNA pseudouridine(38-40) synthase TruA [uncultured Dokdonia sp.]|uniref:tRNA pseudouridine(38-40) synthase TruA n=1 Tax=uncultured Dokdonia sp. TaxID=575653 RepID=UPI002612446F|nr:tRNA pseudouridine(38-40) synthase TruA [uncultured Dokdonia sp.]
MRYFIQLSYNGTPYHGWQRQPNAVTVQQTIEEALSTLLRMPTTIMGAGRTDTGVHARMMYAHVNIENEDGVDIAFAKADLTKLTYKLNSFLPPSIAITQIIPVTPEAHARFDATHRSYIYRISPTKNPFTQERAFYYKIPLDIQRMQEASNILLRYSDFECFSRSNTDVNTYLCDIKEASWSQVDDEYHFKITADRFLRNMVRAVVGTLIEIGQGKKSVSWMHEVIKGKNRSLAGASAPAHGLYLTDIGYPKHIFIN